MEMKSVRAKEEHEERLERIQITGDGRGGGGGGRDIMNGTRQQLQQK